MLWVFVWNSCRKFRIRRDGVELFLVFLFICSSRSVRQPVHGISFFFHHFSKSSSVVGRRHTTYSVCSCVFIVHTRIETAVSVMNILCRSFCRIIILFAFWRGLEVASKPNEWIEWNACALRRKRTVRCYCCCCRADTIRVNSRWIKYVEWVLPPSFTIYVWWAVAATATVAAAINITTYTETHEHLE